MLTTNNIDPEDGYPWAEEPWWKRTWKKTWKWTKDCHNDDTAVEITNGPDQLVFTPIRWLTVFLVHLSVFGRMITLAGILALVPLGWMIALGSAAGIGFVLLKLRRTETDYDLTRFKKVKSRFDSTFKDIQPPPTITREDFITGLEKTVEELGYKPLIKKMWLDTDDRVKILFKNTKPPLNAWAKFRNIAWTALGNYSMYYWIFWFPACVLAGQILAIPPLWVPLAALGATILVPVVIKIIKDVYHKIRKPGESVFTSIYTNDGMTEPLGFSLDEEKTKEIASYCFIKLYHQKTGQYLKSQNQNPGSLPRFITKARDYVKSNHHTLRIGMTAISQFVNGWIGTIFAWWPISDIILKCLVYFGGFALSSSVFMITSLGLTTLGFGIAIALGIRFAWLGICEKKKTLDENAALVRERDAIPANGELHIPKISSNIYATDDEQLEYTDKVLRKGKINQTLQDASKRKWWRGLDLLVIFIARFGTGILMIRFLLLDGTIGAIFKYGFTEAAFKTIAIGGFAGMSAWAFITIIAIAVGIIYGVFKMYEYRLNKTYERNLRVAKSARVLCPLPREQDAGHVVPFIPRDNRQLLPSAAASPPVLIEESKSSLPPPSPSAAIFHAVEQKDTPPQKTTPEKLLAKSREKLHSQDRDGEVKAYRGEDTGQNIVPISAASTSPTLV